MSSLIEFLKKQKEIDRSIEITRERKLLEWLRILNRLFSQVERWLSEAEKQGLITVTKGKIEIKEDTLGTYKAPLLTIATSRNSLRIRPIGSTIIGGANGRVDIESKIGAYMLLYLANEGLWVHSTKGEDPTHCPKLTEELFHELLKKSLS